MSLSVVPQDILQEILRLLSVHDINNLSMACTILRSVILEDKYIWTRILGKERLRLPTNSVPLEEASVHTVRAWFKHAFTLRAAYAKPSLKRSLIRIDTPARVTFARLLRGRWCVVASSNTSISELSVWEIVSPTSCALRCRIYLQAPVLDGLVDDGGHYVRLAITVGTCRPSIKILEIAKDDAGCVVLLQCAEIADASRVLCLRDNLVSFACLRGDDTWPFMKNWASGNLVKLGEAASDIPTLPVMEHCAGIYVWRTFIISFSYSVLRIYDYPIEKAPTGTINPIKSIPLPQHPDEVTFLNEKTVKLETGGFKSGLNWAARVNSVTSVLFTLTCIHHADSTPRFKFTDEMFIINPDEHQTSTFGFSVGESIGKAGGYVVHLSVPRDNGKYLDAPAYTVIALQTSNRPTPLSRDRIEIPKVGLPFSSLVTCLDFDDGNGLLLIGSEAGQFCIVNFANAILPDDAILWQLPSIRLSGSVLDAITPLQLDMPAFYSYGSHLDYDVRDCPPCVVEDAIRQWGDVFRDHSPIPRWSSNWKEFSLIKDWIPPISIWPMHDSSLMAEVGIHEVRNRLRLFGDVIPILYDEQNHARVIFRSGDRVIYCWSTTRNDDDNEDSSYPELLGLLPISYADFVAASSATILSHINDFGSQRNLDSRDPQASFEWRLMSANFIRTALRIAAEIGKEPDERKLDEWTEEDWHIVKERFKSYYYG